MRNLLIILILCALTLTTSNVFAEGYDASKRSERLGLSFYDGRPLYVVGFGRLTGSSFSPPTRCLVYRVYTDDKLSDYGTIDYGDGRGEQIYENGQYVEMMFYHYVLDDSGEPVILSASNAFAPGNEAEFVRYHLKNLRFTASSSDVAVDIFDAMLEPLSEMLRGWLGVVLAIGAVMFGWNFIRELWTLDFSGKSKVKNGKASAPLSYAKLSRRDRSFYEDAALGDTTKFLVPKSIKKDVDFVTGAAFGLKFDEKTRESNRLLMEAFNRLSRKEQRQVLEAFRETAFDKSFEDSAEKRFLAYQGEVFENDVNPFTGRIKRPAFDRLDFEPLDEYAQAQGYGIEYVGWDVVSSVDEIDDANASLDEAYYDDNGGTPF